MGKEQSEIVDMVRSLASKVDAMAEQVQQLGGIKDELVNLNKKVETLKATITSSETKFDEMFKQFDSKFEALDKQLDGKFEALYEQFDGKFEALREQFDDRLFTMRTTFLASSLGGASRVRTHHAGSDIRPNGRRYSEGSPLYRPPLSGGWRQYD